MPYTLIQTDAGKVMMTNILLNGGKLTLKKIGVGETIASNPESAGEVPNLRQTFSGKLYLDKLGSRLVIEAQLTNAGLAKSYPAQTIGAYASDGTNPPVLFAVMTDKNAGDIAAESDYPVNKNIKMVFPFSSDQTVNIKTSFNGYARVPKLVSPGKIAVISDSGDYESGEFEISDLLNAIDIENEYTSRVDERVTNLSDYLSERIYNERERAELAESGLHNQLNKKLGITGTAANSDKLGGQFPYYYASKNLATASSDGLMSATDKAKLDSITSEGTLGTERSIGVVLFEKTDTGFVRNADGSGDHILAVTPDGGYNLIPFPTIINS
ncbi:MAG: hypothetical protein LBR74_05725 [Eubacterium sp.]|jgi:hypothetical protein|nr:hypothetical protein [Eubacterium sp.]